MKRLVLCVLCCASLASAEDAWEIKFARAFTKGAKFKADLKVSHDSDSAMPGMGSDQSTLSVELKGLVEVLKVDDKGRIVEATCKVETCVIKDTGKSEESEPFPAGHVLKITSAGGKLVVDTAGKTYYEKAKDLLPRLWPWEAIDAASPDDGVFGTAGKKKVGDTWTLDGPKVVAKLTELTKLKMDAKKVTATGKLVGVIDLNGVKCLDIQVDIAIPDVEFKGHLALFEPTGTTLAASFHRALPIDAKIPCPRWTTSFDSDVPMQGIEQMKGQSASFKEGEKHELSLTPAK